MKNNHLRRLHKRNKQQFKSITLKVDDKGVNLDYFRMIHGVDFHYGGKGLVLDKKFEFTATWTEGGVTKQKRLTGEVGYTYDGCSIPKFARKFIGKPLSPQFMLPSLGHDLATEDKVDHFVESMILYKLLHYQKGRMDISWLVERLMYIAVYAWSVVS